MITLPAWASFKLDDDGQPRLNGRSLMVDINTHEAYPMILEEYRVLYTRHIPAEFKDGEEIKPEWVECLKNLDPADPTSYWMEVAHQSCKLDVQVACRTFALNLHFRDRADPETGKRRYNQAQARKGRDPLHAAGGGGLVKRTDEPRGVEARQHYKRLRGFILS